MWPFQKAKPKQLPYLIGPSLVCFCMFSVSSMSQFVNLYVLCFAIKTGRAAGGCRNYEEDNSTKSCRDIEVLCP